MEPLDIVVLIGIFFGVAFKIDLLFQQKEKDMLDQRQKKPPWNNEDIAILDELTVISHFNLEEAISALKFYYNLSHHQGCPIRMILTGSHRIKGVKFVPHVEEIERR